VRLTTIFRCASISLLGFTACATATSPADQRRDAGDSPDGNGKDARDIDAKLADARPIDARPIDARPIDARPIDARPDSPPDACVPANRQLLTNSNLESPTNWRQVPNDPTLDIITTAPSGGAAFSGTHLAWLGGALSATDELSQDAAIPATTTALSVSFKYAIGTEETTTTSKFDKLVVTLATTAGATLATLGTLSNLDHNTAYATFNATSATTFAGQTIRLVLRSTTDFSNNTNFFVDDITVNVTACP
jgi:hypothetical protein